MFLVQHIILKPPSRTLCSVSRVLYFYQIQIPLQRQQPVSLLLAYCRTKRVSSWLGQTLPAMWGQFLQNSTQTKAAGQPGKWPRNSPPLLRKISRMECLWIAAFQNDTFAHMAEKDMAWSSAMNAIIWAFSCADHHSPCQICKDTLGGNLISKAVAILQKMWPQGWKLVCLIIWPKKRPKPD